MSKIQLTETIESATASRLTELEAGHQIHIRFACPNEAFDAEDAAQALGLFTTVKGRDLVVCK